MKNSTSVIILVISLLLAFAGWATTLKTWGDGLAPGTLSGLLQVEGGIVLAWLSASPLKPKSDGPDSGGKVPFPPAQSEPPK